MKKDLGEPQPLLLDSRTDEFLYPETSDGEIEFSRGETVKLYCTEGFRSTFRGKKSITATCVAGKQFKVDTKIVDISKIVCTDSPKHIARRTNNTCTAGRIIEIGFQIQNDANEKDEKWLQVMRVCHNETIASTNWVQYKQQPSNRGYQHSGKAIRFVQGDFYEGKTHFTRDIFSIIIETRFANNSRFLMCHLFFFFCSLSLVSFFVRFHRAFSR